MSASDNRKPDVFFYEAFREEEDELKPLLGTSCSCEFSPQTIQELGHKDPPSKLISIRTQSKIPLEWSKRLDGILSRSTGYDHLIAYRSKITNPLPMGYLNEYASRAVAEHAILLAMALLRKLPQQMIQFKTFERDGLTGLECAGKNLLVVGVGRIGGEICRIGVALGFNVRGVDLVRNKPYVVYCSKEEGIAWGDVVICAMNLTDENRGYFNYDFLRHAKQGAILVNIARGEHTPVLDLTRILEENLLGGVGLDVYEDEGALGASLRGLQAEESGMVRIVRRLAGRPNVILTPHNAFNTTEAVKRKSQMSVDQVKHFLRHNDFIWKLK
jgi:D-lactate dehydrogenase